MDSLGFLLVFFIILELIDLKLLFLFVEFLIKHLFICIFHCFDYFHLLMILFASLIFRISSIFHRLFFFVLLFIILLV